MNEKHIQAQEIADKESRHKRKAWPFLLITIILALLAAQTIHTCLYMLYLAFVKQERVFGLLVAVPMDMFFFILFTWGAIMAFLKYRRVKAKIS